MDKSFSVYDKSRLSIDSLNIDESVAIHDEVMQSMHNYRHISVRTLSTHKTTLLVSKEVGCSAVVTHQCTVSLSEN